MPVPTALDSTARAMRAIGRNDPVPARDVRPSIAPESLPADNCTTDGRLEI